MKVQWSHCVLRVRDLEGMIRFYSDTLGFVVADRGPIGPNAEIVFLSGSASDHHQIALTNTRDENEASSLDHVAFRVEALSDVRELFERLKQDDRVGPVAPLTHGNAISVYFADPEGNGIEVFCDTPWHVQQPQVRGWNPAMSDEEVLDEVEKAFSDAPEFSPMANYRNRKASEFGES